MTVTDPTWLTVNGVDLATHAWRITDLSDLLADGPVRGRDRVIPLNPGARPYRRRRTVRVASLPMDIYGHYEQDGTPISDPMQGVIDHMLWLSGNLGIGEDAAATDGTVDAVWHLPDGGTLHADVHVLSLDNVRDLGPGLLRCVLDLSFPTGGFVEVVAS